VTRPVTWPVVSPVAEAAVSKTVGATAS
jgi:hypothetical protein